MGDAEERGQGGVRPPGLDSTNVGRLDAIPLRGLFDRPATALAQLAQSPPELGNRATKGSRLTMVSGFRDPVLSGGSQGKKTGPLKCRRRDL
jgi:hypothetical protein